MTEYYKVDGLRCETAEQARTLAHRLFKRYDETRTITVIYVDEEVGYETDHYTLESTKPNNEHCEFTRDLFE